MSKFNNSEYEKLIENLLHDTRYIEISNMGKIAGIRKHAEVLVRKILNLGQDISLTLGEVKKNSKNKDIYKALNTLEVGVREKLFDTVKEINKLGNEGTHTQRTSEFSDEEVNRAENSILELYSILFINYLLKIKVSIFTPSIILYCFSLLPPIIRYNSWKYLFEIDKKNIQIANRLCLSIIKVFDKTTAYKWLNDNADTLKKIPYPTDEEQIKYIKTCGIEICPNVYSVSLDFPTHKNIYELLYAKINNPSTSINEGGKMYETFEEAIKHYNEYRNNPIQCDSKEINELHSLMDFVYLGRKPK